MKLFKLVLLSFFLTSILKADAIYDIIKIPNLKVYNIKIENKLRYLYADKPFTIGLNKNINCYKPSKRKLENKYKVVEKNLNKYSKEFLKKINLKYIVLCEDLSISGINTAGIPDTMMRTLILDINFNQKYFERVIHHEVFHIINDSFKEFFDENVWSSYNPAQFSYAKCSTCTNKLGLDTFLKPNGFISEYSQSTASEDMAEVFSHIMFGNLPDIIDPILKKKINFIRSNLKRIDKNFFL